MKATVQPLKGHIALVTGASSGIGETVARRLAVAGAAVVVNYRSHPKDAKKIAAEIKSTGGQAIAVHADMSKEREIKILFARMFREFGAIDILVNNAGIENKSPFLKMPIKNWDQVMAVNLRGVFLCSQLAARRMVKNGGGVIINISSVHQSIPWGGLCALLRVEKRLGHVDENNGVGAGGEKGMGEQYCARRDCHAHQRGVVTRPARREQVLALIPLRRIGQPEEVAGAVMYLVSDEAAYITGTTLLIDGGMSLYSSFLGQA